MVRSVCVLLPIRICFILIIDFLFIFLVPPSNPETSEDSIVVNSPTLDMGLLFNNHDINVRQQFSPITRSLSNVGPIDVVNQSWEHFFDFDCSQYPTNNGLSSWSTKSFDEAFSQYQDGHDLEGFFNDFFDEYLP